jgi:hypothetical protein
MKKLLVFFISISLFQSCSQKVYFFEADKLEMSEEENIDIEVNAFFGGDALDYVVFELDVKNNTSDSLYLDYKDVYLKINESQVVLNALNRDDLIFEAEARQQELTREKRGRDIGNAISIGLDLLLIGTGNANALGTLIYSTETAAYMLEDSRAYKLLKGSLDEQIEYIEDWVLFHETVPPQNEDSWDVLFERQLFDAEADLIVKIGKKKYTIPFKIRTIEEKVR